ncbi:hypothetical protein B0H63DRAFT_29711 [Podospora didyma]|uniref:Uncharacterized protein n=1 Tax=Podospora didyma TaxID=330526 RepID=A0AAE0U7H1_9PEZI|nr:hypothetical protein B0H63DRAFT_29711 [Podospora didyma]
MGRLDVALPLSPLPLLQSRPSLMLLSFNLVFLKPLFSNFYFVSGVPPSRIDASVCGAKTPAVVSLIASLSPRGFVHRSQSHVACAIPFFQSEVALAQGCEATFGTEPLSASIVKVSSLKSRGGHRRSINLPNVTFCAATHTTH